MTAPGPREEKGGWGEGGYDCEFVGPPLVNVQTECSVCLLILREPTIVSCCGHSFCQTCIERVQASGKTCPLCNCGSFTSMREKRLQRQLNEQQVWCMKKEVGCEWKGELGKLEEHLNVAPEPERLQEGCAFVEVECSFCHESIQRRTIDEHENDQCPQRPYSCDYCRAYEGSFDDVVNKHYPVCTRYLLPCPNKCNELQEGFEYMIERQDLEHHIKEECPLTVVECGFHYAGCRVKLPRKDVAGHLAESLVTHMSLLAVHGKKVMEDRDKQVTQLREDTNKQVAQMEEEIKELKRENRSLKDRLHSHLHTPPVTFTMTNFEQHKKNKDGWYSPPFYTHPYGYKICIKVVCKDNSCFVGACLMHGEFDDYLQWPFQSDVYIRILNRLSDNNHIVIIGNFSSGPTSFDIGVRVRAGERQLKGPGEHVPYALLNCQEDSTENCQYLSDDCLQFQVPKVIGTVQLQREIVATIDHRSLRTSPCQLIMRDFEQYKEEGWRWYSPSFYTHTQGYRMCLRVDSNGFCDGRGTHVSVFIQLMCGEFDSHIKWPFRGIISIQLLNQLENKQHHKETISFTDMTPDEGSGRVTVGERGWAWGKQQFIPHSELGLNQTRNCQYLKDGCLFFRIKNIDWKCT